MEDPSGAYEYNYVSLRIPEVKLLKLPIILVEIFHRRLLFQCHFQDILHIATDNMISRIFYPTAVTWLKRYAAGRSTFEAFELEWNILYPNYPFSRYQKHCVLLFCV